MRLIHLKRRFSWTGSVHSVFTELRGKTIFHTKHRTEIFCKGISSARNNVVIFTNKTYIFRAVCRRVRARVAAEIFEITSHAGFNGFNMVVVITAMKQKLQRERQRLNSSFHFHYIGLFAPLIYGHGLSVL